MAVAIQHSKLTEASLRQIRTARIVFTSLSEILPCLEILNVAGQQLTGLNRIVVKGHRAEEAIWAINMLGSTFKNVQLELESESMDYYEASGYLNETLLSRLESLKVPIVLRSVLCSLTKLQTFEIKNLCHDSDATLPTVPVKGRLSWSDWHALGDPAIEQLELSLWQPMCDLSGEGSGGATEYSAPEEGLIEITNSALTELKLVADSGYTATPTLIINAPSLRMLVFSNISPDIVEGTLLKSDLSRLEFLSLEPASLSALRGCFMARLESLSLIFALIMPGSFETNSETELANLVAWLQTVASRYPIDVRDYTGLISSEIYFSDGLWCSISHGTFRKYLSQFRPTSYDVDV